MSEISFRELDEQIKNTKINDLIALNQTGEKSQIDNRIKTTVGLMLIASSAVLLFAFFTEFSGTLKESVQLGLSLLAFGLMLWSYFRDTKTAMLSIATLLSAYGVYNLLIIGVLDNEMRITNILLGVLNIFFALQYIQDANQYEQFEKTSPNASHTLYDTVFTALATSEPNNSNALIELYSLRQTITVWLRPSGVVILMKNDKRLYFDVHQSFSITANGDDGGGDRINVTASIINKRVNCAMTRHGWLRYTRFIR